MAEVIVTPLGTVSPYPKGDKNCPGFFIEYSNDKIMLDCGNGCTRLLDFSKDLNNLKVFISHLHPDHYGDLLCLMQSAMVYKKFGYLKDDLEIYVPDGDKVNIDRYYSYNNRYETDHLLDYKLLEGLANKSGIKFIGYESINKKINDISIKSLYVPHQINSYAFRVDTPEGSIVYSSDTGTNNNLRNFAKDCDLFICEATFLKGQLRSENAHLYAWEAAEIAKDANVKKLLLTHFWPEIDKEKYLDEAMKIFENTEVAEEGKKLVLKR